MLRPFRADSLMAIVIAALPLNAMAGPGAGGDTYSVSAPEKDKPMVTATVAADRQAVGPGDTFNALVTLKMAEGVHVYWRNPGETGLPTKFRWSGPEGFRFGRTQFPAPETKYDKVLKETSFIHSDSAMFLTPIKAPDALKAGETLTFQVDVSWLSCKKGACVPGGEKLTLKLPAAAKSKPADDDALGEFDAARNMFPSPSDKAEHLKINVRTSKASVRPGESFDVIVTAQIEAKHHMQSDKPLEDYLIPAYVFVEPVPDAEIGEVVYPKSHIRNDPMMGRMSEYSGTMEFKFPVTLEKETDNKPRWIRGILQSQICTDEGTCYAPQTNAFAVAIQIEGGPAPAATPEEFVAAAPMASDGGTATDDESTTKTGEATTRSEGWISRTQEWLHSFGYVGVLFSAFIGGIILNLMPCV
ncbi:MAG: hypothetical protein KDA33_15685, partial [Phycisphaerales bacterium]|nr:hypothetical protein [Phycisphaerales bacterium]